MANALRKQDDPFFTFHAPVSAAEYLSEELGATTKCEFIDGFVFAMAGTTDWHNLVVLNFIALLNQKLPDDCRALGMDVKLRLQTQTSERYYYPDTFVSCGTPLKNEHVHADATLVAEVVSPTTLRFDRGEKMHGYRTLPSIEQYLLIWPDQPFAEVYSRTTNWEMTTVSGGGILKLDCLRLEVEMKDLYRRVPVVFPEAP